MACGGEKTGFCFIQSLKNLCLSSILELGIQQDNGWLEASLFFCENMLCRVSQPGPLCQLWLSASLEKPLLA